MNKIASCILVFFASISLYADVLSVDGKELVGVFCGFAKKRLIFQQWQEDTPSQYAIKEVERLQVDQPVRVAIAYARNTRQKSPGVLHGYKKGEFDLEASGKRSATPDWRISQIEVKIEIRDFMRRREQALQAATSTSTLFKAADALRPGLVNVVHFHQAGSVSSERQGNYLMRLCEANAKKAVYLQVLVTPNPEDPNMKKHGLQSLPQFWFYSGAGKLQQRLVERFTEADLEKALAEAIRKSK